MPKDLASKLVDNWVPQLEGVTISRPALLRMESLGVANLMYDPGSRRITGLLDYEDWLGGIRS